MSAKKTLLSRQEVWRRLKLCQGDSALDVTDQLYDLGLLLSREALDQIKAIEGKATAFAAYGTGVATLLFTNVATWSRLGNRYSFLIAAFVEFAALSCTYQAVRALQLMNTQVISDEDWFKEKYLKSLQNLKAFHTLAFWQLLDSRMATQDQKAGRVNRAQVSLACAVAYVALLLIQIGLKQVWVDRIVRALDVDHRQFRDIMVAWVQPLATVACVVGIGVVGVRYLRTRGV